VYGAIKVLEFVFFARYITKKINTSKQISLLSLIISASLILQSLLAIAQYLNQGSINNLFYYFGERNFTSSTPGIANASINGQLLLRPYGTFPHPNVLSGYLLTMLLFILSEQKSSGTTINIIKFAASIIGSVALLLTLSRVAIILWLFIFFFLITSKLKTIPGKISLWHKTAILLVLALFIYALLANTPVYPRFFETTLADPSIQQRHQSFQAAELIIKDNFLFGVGLYGFIPSLAKIPLNSIPLNNLQPVHNIFILLLAEIGIIGTLFALYLLLKTYKQLLELRNPLANKMAIILTIILILGTVDHYWLTLQQSQLLLAFMFGISWALKKQHVRHEVSEKFTKPKK
jgi:O-antigen ligase